MSTRIPREFIDQVLHHTNIVDIVNAAISLRKFGANYKACCPFHDEKTPSFVVSPTKQIYHCFGCGAGGNAISFMMEHDRLSFVEAIQALAARAHLSVPEVALESNSAKPQENLYHIMLEASEFYEKQLRENTRAKTYLIERGLSGVIAKKFKLGAAPNAWEDLIHHLQAKKFSLNDMRNAGLISENDQKKVYDKFRDRIMFPLHDRRGRIIAFGGRVIKAGEPKYLNSPETMIFHKSNELYGLYQWLKTSRKEEEIIVVEGYMDVVALVQSGIDNVVGTMGTATTEQHLQILFRYAEGVIFCFDGDEAGRKAAVRALLIALPKLASNKTLRFVFLPEGDDPDTFVRREGVEGFRKAIHQATSLSDFFIQHVMEGLNLNKADHRAKFLHLANQLLQSMTDLEWRRILAQQVSECVRIPVSEILAMLKTSVVPVATLRAPLPEMTIPSAARKAVAIILQYPSQALAVSHLIDELSSQYDLLKQLLDCIKKSGVLTTAHLLEYFRESPFRGALMMLSTQALLVVEEGLAHELSDALEKMLQEEKRQSIDALIAKAQKGALTEDEKQELKAALSRPLHRAH